MIVINFKMIHNNSINNEDIEVKSDNRSLEENTLININNRLKGIFGEESDNFKSVLEKSGARITGSFILQCAINGVFDNSDIDVFIPQTTMKTIHKNPISELNQYLHEKFPKAYKKYIACNRYGTNITDGQKLEWIRNYKINNKSLQLINTSLSNSDIDDFILNNFDFSVCKNIYKIIDGKEILVISYPDNIIKKTFDFEYQGNIGGSLSRYNKYLKRGFNININKNNIYSIYKNHLDKMYVKKTQSRFADYDPIYIFETYTKNINPEFNGNIYTIFPDNIDDYKKINIVEIMNRIQKMQKRLYTRKKCNDYCPFRTFDTMHFHTDGNHIGHGMCEDFVVVGV